MRYLSVLLLLTAAPALAADEGPRRIARAGTRHVALCVGNDTYPGMPLRNARNDARAVCAALAGLGFVTDVQADLGSEGLERAVEAFVGRLGTAEVGFFFYAGHGIQIDGENYLVPADFAAQDEIAAKYRAYRVEVLRERMERSGTRVNVIVLDACRDNPFRFTRSGSRGLGAMQPGRGTLIALATGPGQTASDAPGAPNGLFTTHLLRALPQPGLSIEQVFKQAREAVSEASGQRQRPWLLADLTGEFFLQGPPAASAAAAPASAPAGVGAAEIALWNAVAGSSDPRDVEEYLGKYPAGEFAGVARNRLERLRQPPRVAPELPRVVPPGGPPPPAAKPNHEAVRLEAARAQADETRCAAGSTWDCTVVAHRYANGVGVSVDAARAAALLQRACEASVAGAVPELLERDEGTWDAALESYGNPGTAPTLTRGSETNVLACGGQLLLGTYEGDLMGTPFRGHQLLTWDTATQRGYSSWIDSWSASMSRAEVSLTKDGFTGWIDAIGPDGTPLRFRATMEYSGNTRVYSMYAAGQAGREALSMRIRYTRR